MASQAEKKRFRDGTHRAALPEDTLSRARPLLPVLGITRIANVTGLDTIGLPVVMVCRPNARSLSVAQGKGLSLAAAKASGVMESIETWHAERILSPLKIASARELRLTHRLAETAGLPRLSVSGFHEDRRLPWIEGTDLLSREAVWVPHELVHMDYTRSLPGGGGSFLMTSSGLASGNHPLEALTHAVCELVERDAFTLWRMAGEARQRRTRVDLTTVSDAACREVLGVYERAGVEVSVWEITSDIGIPAFTAAIVDGSPNPQRPMGPMGGHGCHPDRGVALLRALTEAAQSRLTIITGSRDDLSAGPAGTEGALEAARQALSRHHREPVVRAVHDAPTFESDTPDGDLA
ncbi:MAG: YcaO-like family protein [Polyangiaceae bacterium]